MLLCHSLPDRPAPRTCLVALVALLLTLVAGTGSPLLAQDPDAGNGEGDGNAPVRALASYLPPTTILYLEWPDTARNSQWFEPPGEDDNQLDADTARKRADVERFRNQSSEALAHAFGFTAEEADAFRSGSDAMAAGLLDAGQDFSYALVVVRHSKRDAVHTALKRVEKVESGGVTSWTHGDATGFTVQLPGDLDEFGDMGALQASPMGQDPYAMLLSMAGDEVHVLEHGDCLLLSNRLEALTAAYNRQPDASLITLPSYQSQITDAHRAAGMFGLADAGNVRDLIERNLDNRGREVFDRVNGLAEMHHMVAGVMRSSLRADGFRSHMRLALDGHETWTNLRLGAGELPLLNAMPASSLAVFGFHFPAPADDLDRLVTFARSVAVAAEAEAEFDEGLDMLEGELGVPALKEMARPLGGELVIALLPPSPPRERSDGYPYYYLDENPETVLVLSVTDGAAFDDTWKRFTDSPRLSADIGLDDAQAETIAGVPAWVTTNEWGGPCWARVGKSFIFTGDRYALESMIRTLQREPGSSGTLGAAPGWKAFRASFPDKVSKLFVANLGVLMSTYTPQADDVLTRLGSGAWIGLSTEEAEHLDVRVHLYADGFRDRIATAISAAYEQMRLAGCRDNMRVLGEAIRDYALDRGEYPDDLQDLVETGKFSLAEHGASPVDVYAAELAGKSAEEIGKIVSYEYLKPVAPGKIDPGIDEPWGPPIHSFMLAWTKTKVANGGRHVLMSNGTVHWVTEEHFLELRSMARKGVTRAELDEEWNRQAEQRRREQGAGD